jgi:diguanylate cyclase (GGDEF)-like protein/PAS domain S-box-containing protein
MSVSFPVPHQSSGIRGKMSVRADSEMKARKSQAHPVRTQPAARWGEDEARLRALLRASAAIVWRSDHAGRVCDISLSGPFQNLTARAFLGYRWLRRIIRTDRQAFMAAMRATLARNDVFEGSCRVQAADGEYRWTRWRVVPVVDSEGRLREWVGKASDDHERYLAQERLERSEMRLRLALSAARMVAWEYDPERDLTQRSDNARDLLGLEPDDVAGYRRAIDQRHHQLFRQAYAPGGSMSVPEFRFQHPAGHMMWLSSRGMEVPDGDGGRRIIGVTHDITDRKVAEDGLRRAAQHDALTGLFNRAHFMAMVKRQIADRDATGIPLAVILLDLDDFKGVNAALGHEGGDAMLRDTAMRLRSVVGDAGLIARLGGDEFGILLTCEAAACDALDVANRLIAEIGRDIYRAEGIVVCRARAGVAIRRAHEDGAEDLLGEAQTALVAAKAADDTGVLLFDPAMRAAAAERASIAGNLRIGLERDEIVPYYQAKVDLASGQICGFEALARWRHPSRGILAPGAFASAFDEPELALGIGRAMARKVIKDLRSWLDAGLAPGPVAINLSPADFGQCGLAEALPEMLARAGIPTHYLAVEVTESVFLGKGGGHVAEALGRLHDAGIRIALDDFGTGFASLTHLKQFPVHEIKIDQSFVRDLENDPDDAAIVDAVTGLGRALGLDVTAEGVETQAQADFLVQRGCELAQGYLFFKPVSVARATVLLRRQALARNDSRRARIASNIASAVA